MNNTLKIETTYVPSLYPEFKGTSPERIEELYSETVDRWTWETDSDEDRALLEKLDIERHYRRTHKSRKLLAGWTVEPQQDLEIVIGEGVEEELIEAMASEINEDIKKRALEPFPEGGKR